MYITDKLFLIGGFLHAVRDNLVVVLVIIAIILIAAYFYLMGKRSE